MVRMIFLNNQLFQVARPPKVHGGFGSTSTQGPFGQEATAQGM